MKLQFSFNATKCNFFSFLCTLPIFFFLHFWQWDAYFFFLPKKKKNPTIKIVSHEACRLDATCHSSKLTLRCISPNTTTRELSLIHLTFLVIMHPYQPPTFIWGVHLLWKEKYMRFGLNCLDEFLPLLQLQQSAYFLLSYFLHVQKKPSFLLSKNWFLHLF